MRYLSGGDKWTKHTFAHKVECKGPGDPHIVSKIVKSIDESGNVRVMLKGDGEPALVQVQDMVKQARPQETIVKNPPAYDPQSNGAAERAVQEVKDQIRLIKIGLEARLARAVAPEWAIMDWVINHASGIINRFVVGVDGRTAYYRTYGRTFSGKTFELGEQVWLKPKRSKTMMKKRGMDAKWQEGTWVGFEHRPGEPLVVVADGGPALRVRTVRARPQSERWSTKAIEEIVATPDKPNPQDPEQRMPNPERKTQGTESRAQQVPGVYRAVECNSKGCHTGCGRHAEESGRRSEGRPSRRRLSGGRRMVETV